MEYLASVFLHYITSIVAQILKVLLIALSRQAVGVVARAAETIVEVGIIRIDRSEDLMDGRATVVGVLRCVVSEVEKFRVVVLVLRRFTPVLDLMEMKHLEEHDERDLARVLRRAVRHVEDKRRTLRAVLLLHEVRNEANNALPLLLGQVYDALRQLSAPAGDIDELVEPVELLVESTAGSIVGVFAFVGLLNLVQFPLEATLRTPSGLTVLGGPLLPVPAIPLGDQAKRFLKSLLDTRDIVLAGENLCRREEFIGRVSSALPVVGKIA